MVAVVIGSQLADVIDKPLAWWVGIFPTGRDLGHSLLFAVVVIAVVYAAAIERDRLETATAFTIAHLSHLLADLSPRLLLGYPFGSEFLLWPVVSHNTFGYNEQLFDPPAAVELIVTPFTDPGVYLALELTLVVVAIGVWIADGRPGVQYLHQMFGQSREQRSAN